MLSAANSSEAVRAKREVWPSSTLCLDSQLFLNSSCSFSFSVSSRSYLHQLFILRAARQLTAQSCLDTKACRFLLFAVWPQDQLRCIIFVKGIFALKSFSLSFNLSFRKSSALRFQAGTPSDGLLPGLAVSFPRIYIFPFVLGLANSLQSHDSCIRIKHQHVRSPSTGS